MTSSILHITDAASSGVLAAVTTFARAQSAVPGIDVTLAYVPRHDSPSPERIQALAGDRVTVLRWSRSPRTALPALLVRATAELTARRDVLVHLHSSRTGMIGRAVAVLTGHRDRTVYSPHCFAFDRSDAGTLHRRVLTALERAGTLLGPRLLLVSETEERLAQRVLPRARTAVLRNRVDAEQLAALPRPEAASGGDLRVVHVGRIAAQKRPREFDAVARRWHEQHPGTVFRWLGEGDRELLGPDVEVSGWLDRDALLAELSRADVLLFTSAGEGLPIAVLEAQALGVPVLAHDVTGMADVVIDGVTGLLRADAEGLLQALGELAADPARRRALGETARARVRACFGLTHLAEDSFAAYRQVGVPIGEESA
ncbi:glycosyltransferase [Brachybacterium sp. GCM10030267]|uniref:glycosyltransferase n=1 Tax=unclassified Brachybacterium TaxID=2623841 RepID=UPI00360960F7